ncbi:MAG: hypothetical protein ACOYO1_01495 [Bacteroidales bacterium]
MNKSSVKGFYIFFFILISLKSFGEFESQDSTDFNKFKFLEGKWEIDNLKDSTYEEWVFINDSLLSGKSFTVIYPDTIVNERLSISKKENAIFYIAEVNEQNNGEAVYFKLNDIITNDVFTFENPLHDFPKSINYVKINDITILVWIEGNGKRIEFKMKKRK